MNKKDSGLYLFQFHFDISVPCDKAIPQVVIHINYNVYCLLISVLLLLFQRTKCTIIIYKVATYRQFFIGHVICRFILTFHL